MTRSAVEGAMSPRYGLGLALVLALVALAAPSVHAAPEGFDMAVLSPGPTPPGATAASTVSLRNVGPTDVHVVLSAEDVTPGVASRVTVEWLEPAILTVPSGGWITVDITLSVPADAEEAPRTVRFTAHTNPEAIVHYDLDLRVERPPSVPERPVDPCCWEITATNLEPPGHAGIVYVMNGWNVSIANTGNQSTTVHANVRASNDAFSFSNPLATVALSPGESKTIRLPLNVSEWVEPGEYYLEAAFVMTDAQGSGWPIPGLSATLRVERTAAHLANERVLEFIDLKPDGNPGHPGVMHVGGGEFNVSAGETFTARYRVINRADHALDVRIVPRVPLKWDPYVEAVAAAAGFDEGVEPGELTLAPFSSQPVTLTVKIPRDAQGESVSAMYSLIVNNSVKEEENAFWVALNVTGQASPTPDVETETSPEDVETAVAKAPASPVGANAAVALLLVGTVALVPAGIWLRRDASRWGLACLLAPLYTRLAKADVLEHARREELHRAIVDYPGMHYSALKSRTGLQTGALVHHLQTLERHGLVTSQREGQYRRFYPATARMPPAPAPGELAPTPMQARVLETLRARPLTQSELGTALGLAQQTVSHHVRNLERAGLVERDMIAGEWRYRAK